VRVLVLYVDRDGDLKSQGLETPIIGRDEVLRAGIKYILKNPDDSDANAVFAAVKIYDKLAAEYGAENVNVAIVSGSADPAVADFAVLKELGQILAVFDADAIYFVSDGPSDEAAIPAIQTKRPVVSVHRVVVKQARGVEETVTLFRHYLNKAVREPEYRRYTVGVPALLVFILLLGAVFNQAVVWQVLNVAFLFLAFFVMLYGFGIYDFLREILKKFEVTFIITIVSLFVLVIYIAQIILKVSLMPEYIPQRLVVVAVSTLPFISYVAEGYLATRKVKYGGIVAGGTSFSFFYFLLPVLVENRGFAEVLFAVALFLASTFAVILATYFVRILTRR
jgi:putative membrane protein